MADLIDEPPSIESRTWAARWRDLPLALRIGILYVASRLVTTGFLVAAAALAGPGSRIGAGATIADVAVAWDAEWYGVVAFFGYPTELPLTDTGEVAENSWAFMPIYAYAARGVATLLGGWGPGAVLVSLIAGYLACLVLYRLTVPRIGESPAMWTVLFFASAPLAAMFQVGYAEALFLLWLFLALWAVQRRAYAWLYLLVPLMGFTRPGVLAFALFLGMHAVHRWVTRSRESFPVSQIVHVVLAGGLAVVVGFSWQVIAGLATGRADAYLATELSWRRNWIVDPSVSFVPFEGFLRGVAFWFTSWGADAVVGYVVLGLVVLGLAAILLFEPHVRRLGVDLRLWAASYLAYLLLVFFPQSSIFRLLVPLTPLWGAFAVPRSRTWRVAVLIGCLVGQWAWIHTMYAADVTYWRIP